MGDELLAVDKDDLGEASAVPLPGKTIGNRTHGDAQTVVQRLLGVLPMPSTTTRSVATRPSTGSLGGRSVLTFLIDCCRMRTSQSLTGPTARPSY